jgi:hypothetical protein
MAGKTNEGKNLPVRILRKGDEGVNEMFTKFLEKKLNKAKEAFKSLNEEGFACDLPIWSVGMLDKATGKHMNKLIPLPTLETAYGMDKYMVTKRNGLNQLMFQDPMGSVGLTLSVPGGGGHKCPRSNDFFDNF